MTPRDRVSRREWLVACGSVTAGIAGLAGCLGGESDDGGSTDAGAPGDGSGAGADGDGTSAGDGPSQDETERLPGWPMYAADHRSSGWNPDTTGPTGEVQERWSKEYDARIAMSGSPVIADGVLYVGWKDAVFRAFDVESGEVLWDRQFDGWYETISHTALVVEDTVYVSWTEAVVALDVSDGSERWSTEQDTRPFHLYYYDDDIYATKGKAGVDSAQIVRYDPDDGTEEVVYEFESDQISETLAIAVDVAYVAVDDEIVAVDVASGEEDWRWSHPEGDPMYYAGATVADGLVYATSSLLADQNELPGCFAIGVESGDEEWRFTPDTSGLDNPPAVADGVVYVSGARLWAVDAASGEELWTSEEASSYAKPAIVDGTVYVWGEEVYAVDAAEGEIDWTWPAQRSGILHLPMVSVHDGTVALSRMFSIVTLEAA